MCQVRKAIEAAKRMPRSPYGEVKAPCPQDSREYFVIHSTAGFMSERSIKAHTGLDKVENAKQAEQARRAAEAKNTGPKQTTALKRPKKPIEPKRSKAHVYVNPDGSKIWVWPFAEKNVWATKAESRADVGKQKMVHVELNYGAPDVPTDAQYSTLVELYLEASRAIGKWLIIVPHIEVDRGLAGGHRDPEDFDYNKFYNLLQKSGVPTDSVQKFSHDRYWGKPSYKIPWGTDTFSFPPVLSGDPHASPKK